VLFSFQLSYAILNYRLQTSAATARPRPSFSEEIGVRGASLIVDARATGSRDGRVGWLRDFRSTRSSELVPNQRASPRIQPPAIIIIAADTYVRQRERERERPT